MFIKMIYIYIVQVNLPKKMPNLKELVVVLDRDYCDKRPLVQFINWCSMTPSLQRFVVEVTIYSFSKILQVTYLVCSCMMINYSFVN